MARLLTQFGDSTRTEVKPCTVVGWREKEREREKGPWTLSNITLRPVVAFQKLFVLHEHAEPIRREAQHRKTRPYLYYDPPQHTCG